MENIKPLDFGAMLVGKVAVNKFGVPHRRYRLALADGSSRIIDIGCDEDWGDIQPMLPTDYPTACPADWSHRIGLGNDVNGHIEILAVTDLTTGRTYRNLHYWATHHVWCYVNNYAA